MRADVGDGGGMGDMSRKRAAVSRNMQFEAAAAALYVYSNLNAAS